MSSLRHGDLPAAVSYGKAHAGDRRVGRRCRGYGTVPIFAETSAVVKLAKEIEERASMSWYGMVPLLSDAS